MIKLNLIKTWLNKNKNDQIRKNILGAILSFFGGIVVLIITFEIAYLVAWLLCSGFSSLVELFLGTKFILGKIWLLIVSGIFVLLLFFQYAKMDPLSWGRYKRKESDFDPRLKSDLEELLPEVKIIAHSGMVAKLFTDLLVIGPQLLLRSLIRLKELSRITSMEIDKLAEALNFIYIRHEVVPYEEFCEAGWGGQIKHLKHIEDVYFLKKGLSLSEELKFELNNLK